MGTTHDSSGSARTIVGAVILILIAGVIGIGFAVSMTGDARVTGTATLDGQPLAGAQVVFHRDDAEPMSPVYATTDDQGRYALAGNTGGGLPPGRYAVTVTKETLKDGSLPQGEDREQLSQDGAIKNSLPKLYQTQVGTPFRFDLVGGSNTIHLELKK